MNTVTTSFTNFLADAASGAGGFGGSQILIWVLMLGGMWFLLIAPQRKKQKKHAQMLEALSTGDNVVTNGGIYGVITNVRNDRFIIRIADNTRIEIGKGFIQSRVENEDEGDYEGEGEDEE